MIKQKKPLAGATIKFLEKGGTITNNNGDFTFDCGKNNELTISYIGYSTVKQNIKNCSENIIIKLTSINNNLNEVEITATSNNNKSRIVF